MAQVLGTSGAWKDVLMQLKNLEGINISTPQEIQLRITSFRSFSHHTCGSLCDRNQTLEQTIC